MGTLLWQVFVDAIQSPIGSFNSAKSMLAKINFPREAILLGGLYMVVFNFFVRLVLVVAVMIFWQVPIDSSLLFFPVAMAAILLTGFRHRPRAHPLGRPLRRHRSRHPHHRAILDASHARRLSRPNRESCGLACHMEPHLSPHHHRPRMPDRAVTYTPARLLDCHGLRRIGHLPRPRAVSTRHAAFDSAYGRVGALHLFQNWN